MSPVALIAQSGAFAITRWSKLAGLAPRYLISVGNQTDLTLGDYLTYLKDDPAVRLRSRRVPLPPQHRKHRSPF